MNKTIAVASGLLVLAAAVEGCAVSQDDASAFREPIPEGGDVVVAVAGTQVSGAQPQSATVHLEDMGSAGSGGASFYELTRQTSDSVDTLTLGILAEIAAVMSYPPTSVTSSQAVWGPGGDALDPVEWRLSVMETAPHSFDYEVDGRPHGSTSDSAWQAIVTGQGYGKTDGRYRSGSFSIDGDALRALDPTRSDGGKVAITYDARSWPRDVIADVTKTDGSGQLYDISVGHAEDGSGTLAMTAVTDVSTPPDGVDENVDENSRWNATGAGRADVKMTGGDFGSQVVLASQCWSSTFAQTFYTDSVDYEPTTGDPSTCAFPQASFDE